MDASHTTRSSSPGDPIPFLEPLFSALHTELVMIITASFMSALTFSVLLALFVFSTKRLRKRIIFILNAAALFLCFVYSFMNVMIGVCRYPPKQNYKNSNIFFQVYAAISPLGGWIPRAVAASAGFTGFLPIIVDCILLYRLFTVFPYHHTHRLKFFLIVVPPLVLKLVRSANIIMYMVDYVHKLRHLSLENVAATINASEDKNMVVAYFLSMADNALVPIYPRCYVETAD